MRAAVIGVALLFIVMSVHSVSGSEHVVLLHGLARSAASMEKMAKALVAAGYTVDNRDYQSRTASVEALAESAFPAAMSTAAAKRAERIHFVTHSMGGILVRAWFGKHRLSRLGRVVMLAPPNGGSEVVDHLRDWKLFNLVNGPAGQELGTDPGAIVHRLGPVAFDLGVIAGDRTINWINSWFMIPGDDDGKVSVERTKVDGMGDHVVIHATHPFMPANREAIELTIRFLNTGSFDAGGR